MADLAFPAATIITMISTIDRDPRGGAAHARLEIGPTLAPGSRRRVCVVSETYPPEINGVAMTLARLVDGLRGRGHAVSVVRPRQWVDRRGPLRDPEEFLVHGAPPPLDPAPSRRGVRGDRGAARLVGGAGGDTPAASGGQRVSHELPQLREALSRGLDRE